MMKDDFAPKDGEPSQIVQQPLIVILNNSKRLSSANAILEPQCQVLVLTDLCPT